MVPYSTKSAMAHLGSVTAFSEPPLAAITPAPTTTPAANADKALFIQYRPS